MAMLDLGGGGGGGRRSHAFELPLIPFIDFLLCLIAFLLVTAVWTQMARLPADALVPKASDEPPTDVPRLLHVEPRGEGRFRLTWREGSTVVALEDVASRPMVTGDGDVSFPELSKAIARNHREHGAHRAATDLTRDRAVLHASNDVAFERVAAWLDAIHAARRPFSLAGTTRQASAFDVAFAVD